MQPDIGLLTPACRQAGFGMRLRVVKEIMPEGG